MNSNPYNDHPSHYRHHNRYPPGQQVTPHSRSLHHSTLPVQSPFLYPQYPLNSLHYTRATLRPNTMSDPSELEQMQRLSETYNPDLPGPLVGNKLPMLDLVTEYSQADPAFVLKTQSLAATHSGYRQIKGDGQCGWRGAVFGYFETLLSIGDLQLVLQEETRLQSYAELMRMAGIDYDIIVDMFDSTWELFADLKSALERGERSEQVLSVPMNDEIRSNSIVYHFKMITSAYLQLYPGNYEHFLEMPVADYRVSRIDPSNQEIDQIGLQVMTDAVIAPAGFALDVYYLDRSVGGEVTSHEFASKNAGSPKICMLYRPGHYDLIYAGTQPVQVYLQSGSSIRGQFEAGEISGFPSDVQAYFSQLKSPMAEVSVSHNVNFENQNTSHAQTTCSSLKESNYIAPRQFGNTTPHPPQHYKYPPGPQSSAITSTSSSITNSSAPNSPTSNGPQPPVPAQALRQLPSGPLEGQSDTGPRIRPTKYIIEYRRKGESVPLLNTPSGAAASHSRAHFRNEGFQPQMWKAEEEYIG